jgi:phage shock protein PspC (stress-responsive transcriptional regulator)
MSKKRLTKGDSFDSMVSGVCSGLSEYFNIDVTILRFIWILTILFYGWGLLPYFILAIIMPNKD